MSYDLFKKSIESQFSVSVAAEYRFHPYRRWRFDYAILSYKIAIEVEGGIYTKGRHTRPTGYLGDLDKYNHAQIMGWIVLRFSPKQLMQSDTFDLIQEAIKFRENDKNIQ